MILYNELTLNHHRELITNAESMRALVLSQGGDDSMKHRVMANVFFEASTRTSCSFQAAMQRLGGSVVCVSEVEHVYCTIS